jgi:Holliday junction resolvase
LWKDRGNNQGWFALRVDDEVYMIPFVVIMAYANEHASLSNADIKELGTLFEKWVKKCK